MGVSGNGYRLDGFCLGEERLHDGFQGGYKLARGIHEKETHIRGDLIIAAAPGVQLAADRAEQLEESPLDGGVDVLVVWGGVEGAVADLDSQGVQGRQDLHVLGVLEQPGPVQDAGAPSHSTELG